MYKDIIKDIESIWSPEKSKSSLRYFRSYIENDIFLWLNSAESKLIAKKYINASMDDLEKLLNTRIHEWRSIALLILLNNYEKSKDNKIKEEIFNFSIKNKHWIDNWDLVDIFSPSVFWDYLYNHSKDREILYKLVKSDNIWDRRISIVSTYYFIKKGDIKDTIKLSEILLNDKEDLIHKATGWMLREVGKKDLDELYKFLDKNYKKMPRTMLRYSIERLEPEKKKHYMTK